jgi:2-polyprenyl-6-methoxyphenol hydroxylase-like FAD-dependent oxidoreductase
MKNANVLISGAGIAGPSLAFWLRRHGFNPTVVERAREVRPGGQAVDFRGEAHLGVLRRMGLLEQVRQVQTGRRRLAIIDERGQPLVTFPPVFLAGDLEVRRGDLAGILHQATRHGTEYLFGDRITALTERRDGVEVTFERNEPRTFDLVVGADGLHSGVRALAFGAEEQFIRFHGYYVATFSAPDHLGLGDTNLIYSVPGRSVTVSRDREPGRLSVALIFASPPLRYDRRDLAEQKALLARSYAGVGWEVPRLLRGLAEAPDLYFDAIARVDVPRYARGRVALLGDAAYGGTLGGQGTGLAVIGAYLLAGELARAGGDHPAAFAAYQDRIGDYARACQQGARHVGPFHAPRTRTKTWLRNQLYGALTSRPLSGLFERLVKSAASDITLEEYA